MSDDLNNMPQSGDRRARANAYAGAARTQRPVQPSQGGASSVVTTVPSSAPAAPAAGAAGASSARPSRTKRPSTGTPSASGSSSKGSGSTAASKPKRSLGSIIVIAIIAVVAAAAIIGAGVWWFSGSSQEFYDTAAAEGQAPYKTDEEIQAELNRVVQDGMLNISIASVIEFENGTSPGVAYIENVPSNKYVMRVEITLDDNGESVYQSGGIRPNHYIESIRLTKDLEAGSYPATATFTAFDPDSLEEVGQAAAKVTLAVEN